MYTVRRVTRKREYVIDFINIAFFSRRGKSMQSIVHVCKLHQRIYIIIIYHVIVIALGEGHTPTHPHTQHTHTHTHTHIYTHSSVSVSSTFSHGCHGPGRVCVGINLCSPTPHPPPPPPSGAVFVSSAWRMGKRRMRGWMDGWRWRDGREECSPREKGQRIQGVHHSGMTELSLTKS